MQTILVINCGSSSLKFGLFANDGGDFKCHGVIDWGGNADLAQLRLHGTTFSELKSSVAVRTHGEAVGVALRVLKERSHYPGNTDLQIKAVGHRVVHGGTMAAAHCLSGASALTDHDTP